MERKVERELSLRLGRARKVGRGGKTEGGRKVANGMKGGESACERPRVKRGKTKGVVENCESRGSIVTPFAGLAKLGRFRHHHHCHYNHHLRQRLPHRHRWHRCYTTALPPSSAAATVAGANPTRLPCFTAVFRIIYRIDRCG